MERYVKQIVLPEIGKEGQEALARARVLVIGCGGLASPVCSYLVAAGIGKLGIVDDDRVEISNLQRQILFEVEDIGKFKVEAAKLHLLRFSKDVTIETYVQKFQAANAMEIASGYDVLIDCTDNFSAKFLLNDVALQLGLPLIFGSVTGFDGQFGVFYGKLGACYRCLYPEPPKALIRNCAESGVLGAPVGVIGAWQALECIKVILDRAGFRSLTPEYGKISIINFLSPLHSAYTVSKRETCICRSPETISIVDLHKPACIIASGDIAWSDAISLENVGFLDVREKEEISVGMVPGAQHWPLSKLEQQEFPSFFDRHSNWVIYCARGQRSRRALELLSLKFGRISFFSLMGGISAQARRFF